MASDQNNPPSLSFSGGGFLSLYQIGAVKAFLDLAPEILRSAPKVYGASAGSVVAAAVVFNLNPDDLQKLFTDAATEARRSFLGPLSPRFNVVAIFKKTLLRLLPENAHQLATGRLNVALTRLVDGKNILVSDYNSKEEVIQALVCSCFFPFYCGLVPPLFRGVRYIDGALTNFHPLFPLQSIITVSPYTGEIDICPRDCFINHFCLQIFNASFQLSIQNLSRVYYALFPPSIFVSTIKILNCPSVKWIYLEMNDSNTSQKVGTGPCRSFYFLQSLLFSEK
ncbi:omega-hydroxyceramide transacylase-like [Gastrophryne carolinensis]